ncbi:ParB N-terminal domain-containing protein [Micromonospora sp. STR1s_5]|nr:ParB N-terminal domain-containing protein [Micromonospora sp. STR1s_5]
MSFGSDFAEGLRRKSQRRRRALADQKEANRPVYLRNDLLPALKLVQRDIAGLRAPARNVRPPEPAHVREIANSIATVGVCRPVLIDQHGHVIDGVAVVEAAGQLGLTEVPCIVVGHLTTAERRVLRLALNRLGEKGRWDLAELRLELQELVIEDCPIEISGFTAIEVDQIMLAENPAATEASSLEPDPEHEPIARPGDIFELGVHRVGCGSALDAGFMSNVMAGMDARLVLTDVPYNVPIRGHVTGGKHREFAMASGEMTPDEFLAFNKAWVEAVLHYVIDGGVIGTFVHWRGYPVVNAALSLAGLDPLNLVVWAKTNAGMGSLYRSAHELLPLYKKGKAAHVNNVELGRHGRWRSNVWTYPGASSIGSESRKGLKSHPTVKPTSMLEDALLDLTCRGETVVDPFLGSGSTLMAAEKAGRVCRGVEIDPLYVDVIIRRFEAGTGKKAVLIET